MRPRWPGSLATWLMQAAAIPGHLPPIQCSTSLPACKMPFSFPSPLVLCLKPASDVSVLRGLLRSTQPSALPSPPSGAGRTPRQRQPWISWFPR